MLQMRGYKQIVRLLPHEVADMEPLLALIEAQDPTDYEVLTVLWFVYLGTLFFYFFL